MNKEFDFDDIGKKTPYRTPDNFFEDMQQKVMERNKFDVNRCFFSFLSNEVRPVYSVKRYIFTSS